MEEQDKSGRIQELNENVKLKSVVRIIEKAFKVAMKAGISNKAKGYNLCFGC